MVPECNPEWNRETIAFFSRLPSLRRLQATPLLQTSLDGGGGGAGPENGNFPLLYVMKMSLHRGVGGSEKHQNTPVRRIKNSTSYNI